jgi:hypothetical protein
MKDLRSELQRSDPVAREAGPSPADVELMRRRILTSKRAIKQERAGARLVLALVLVVAGVSGALLTRARLSPERPGLAGDALGDSHRGVSALRQVQYRTPGGTRVFWTLNPNLEVR